MKRLSRSNNIEQFKEYHEEFSYLTERFDYVLQFLLWFVAFVSTTFRHKKLVTKYGKMLGVSWWQLFKHDLSKFTPVEFWGYLYKYYIYKDVETRESNWYYDQAWLHHQNVNPHHWQYWISYANNDIITYEIPQMYLREMLADWMASHVGNQNKQNMLDWFEERTRSGEILMNSRSIRSLTIMIKNYDTVLSSDIPGYDRRVKVWHT